MEDFLHHDWSKELDAILQDRLGVNNRLQSVDFPTDFEVVDYTPGQPDLLYDDACLAGDESFSGFDRLRGLFAMPALEGFAQVLIMGGPCCLRGLQGRRGGDFISKGGRIPVKVCFESGRIKFSINVHFLDRVRIDSYVEEQIAGI